jgi:hypothetical protein
MKSEKRIISERDVKRSKPLSELELVRGEEGGFHILGSEDYDPNREYLAITSYSFGCETDDLENSPNQPIRIVRDLGDLKKILKNHSYEMYNVERYLKALGESYSDEPMPTGELERIMANNYIIGGKVGTIWEDEWTALEENIKIRELMTPYCVRPCDNLFKDLPTQTRARALDLLIKVTKKGGHNDYSYSVLTYLKDNPEELGIINPLHLNHTLPFHVGEEIRSSFNWSGKSGQYHQLVGLKCNERFLDLLGIDIDEENPPEIARRYVELRKELRANGYLERLLSGGLDDALKKAREDMSEYGRDHENVRIPYFDDQKNTSNKEENGGTK